MRMQTAETAPRILIVDDDRRLCGFLSRLLTRDGYATEIAHDGAAMQRAVANGTFALVILDLLFANGDDGITLARRLRAQYDMPLIMLSGKSATIDKIAGLEMGADDYIAKPFEPREFLARVRAVLRRAAYQTDGPDLDATVIAFAGWRLDRRQRVLISPDDRMVPITSQEFELLSALALRRGRVLSREQILDLVANRRWDPYDRSVDNLVSKIRQKLGDTSRGGVLLKTVRGIGYMLAAN